MRLRTALNLFGRKRTVRDRERDRDSSGNGESCSWGKEHVGTEE